MLRNILCLDFESYYKPGEYSLKGTNRLTTEAYVRDERFSTICLGYDYGDGNSGWVDAASCQSFFRKIDWENTGVLCHNAKYDGFVLSHRYGVYPKFFFDTLSMAHAMVPNQKNSLEDLTEILNLEKKSVPYKLFEGVHPNVMDRRLLNAVGQGSMQDCKLTWQVFRKFMEMGFPRRELYVIDMTIKMFTNPQLFGDEEGLLKIQEDELRYIKKVCADLQITEKDLGSPIKFAKLLEQQGVEV